MSSHFANKLFTPTSVKKKKAKRKAEENQLKTDIRQQRFNQSVGDQRRALLGGRPASTQIGVGASILGGLGG